MKRWIALLLALTLALTTAGCGKANENTNTPAAPENSGQEVPAPRRSAYAAQIRHNRKTYVRFPLDLPPDTLQAFKQACHDAGTTPTTEIKKFIAQYLAAPRE